MKFFYAIAILAQLIVAFFSRSEGKVAYLLYLWSQLSESEGHAGRHAIPSVKVPKYSETRPNVSEKEYSLFLEP